MTRSPNISASARTVRKSSSPSPSLYVVVAHADPAGAVWLALWAANRIVTPIGRLAGAAERVSEGDLARARGDRTATTTKSASLADTFNRMTSQLEAQRKELVDANSQLDCRRRFTEAMLAGVSAGVIGIDGEGHVTLINRAAARLLDVARRKRPRDATTPSRCRNWPP